MQLSFFFFFSQILDLAMTKLKPYFGGEWGISQLLSVTRGMASLTTLRISTTTAHTCSGFVYI